MPLQINLNTGASAQGGPGVGLMTSAGNPWTVADSLAVELVNRGVATMAAVVTPTGAAEQLRTGLPAMGGPLALSIDSASGCTASNATLTYVQRQAPNGQIMRGVRVTSNGGATTNCSVDVPFYPNSTIPNGRVSLLFYIDQPTAALAPGLTLFLGDSAFSSYFQRNTTLYLTGWNQISPTNAASAFTGIEKWTVGGGTPAFGTTSFGKMRVRLDYSAGQAPVYEVYAIVEDGGISPAPICFTFDDGYISQYTLAAPLLERYGLRGSFAVIADLIGSNPVNYMSWDQLRDLRDRGHEINVHGPIGGSGSLLNYASAANRAALVRADLDFHRSAVIANGLNVNGSANCYVLPQGNNAFSNGDMTIRDALAAANLKCVRGVNQFRDDSFHPWGSLYKDCLSIVGHSWGSEGAEPAQITAIQARIADNVAARRPSVCMNHYVVSGTPVQSLEIRATNLELIFQAAAAQIKTGNAVNVTMTGLHKAITGTYPT